MTNNLRIKRLRRAKAKAEFISKQVDELFVLCYREYGTDGHIGMDNVTDYADNVRIAIDDMIGIFDRGIKLELEKSS